MAHNILLIQHEDHVHASLATSSKITGRGATQLEAIGDMLTRHPAAFGIGILTVANQLTVQEIEMLRVFLEASEGASPQEIAHRFDVVDKFNSKEYSGDLLAAMPPELDSRKVLAWVECLLQE